MKLKREECIIGTLVLSTINYYVIVAAGRQLLDTKRQLLAVMFLLSTKSMELYFNNSNYIIKNIQQTSTVIHLCQKYFIVMQYIYIYIYILSLTFHYVSLSIHDDFLINQYSSTHRHNGNIQNFFVGIVLNNVPTNIFIINPKCYTF